MSNPPAPSNTKRFVVVAVALSTVVAATVGGAALIVRQRSHDNVTKLFGGSEGLQALVAPEKVEAFRVRAMPNDENPDSQATVGGATITTGPVAVDAGTARDLAGILKDPHTYGWDFAKGCKFDPGVVLRFTAGTSTVDVILCFHCEELQSYLNGKKVGGEDFDAATARIAAIVKRLFPNDEEIQKL